MPVAPTAPVPRFVITELGNPRTFLCATLPCGVTCVPTFALSGEAEAYRLSSRATSGPEWVVRPVDMKIGVPRE